MSDTVDLFLAQSNFDAVKSRQERPVVLPFSRRETDDAPSQQGNTKVTRSSRIKHGPLPLIKQLCETLNAQQIPYCQWKSNWKLDQWLQGEGDLDLLIDRAYAQRFASIVSHLGFKQAEPPPDRAVPGILNFYGFDHQAGKFVHLHTYFQLVMGHDLTKNYHLSIEKLYLETSVRPDLIPIPAPEMELIVFVIRMVLKYSLLESGLRKITGRAPKIAKSLELQLEYLESRADRARLNALLPAVVPGLHSDFFETCLKSLRPQSSSWSRISCQQKLHRCLRSFARRPHLVDSLLKTGRRVSRLLLAPVLSGPAGKRFVNGGLLIAIVGGDGAGKTTTLNALESWLSKKFVTGRFHIGKPPRAPITVGAIVLLRLRRLLKRGRITSFQVGANGPPSFPGYLQLVRWVCAGRDRSRLYVKARRFATNGGIALCDRYPLPQLHLMESPNIARTVEPKHRHGLVRRMLKAETAYYQSVGQPDLLIVLRVDPEIAVRRKTTESENHVRLRSRELWEQDWEGTNACVVDAGQPVEDVIAELQSIIWARL